MPQSVTSRMNTLKAGSSNWITSTPSACKRARFLVQAIGEGQSHLHAVAVMAVGDGVGDGHRAGQGEFQLAPGMRTCGLRLHRVHAALQLQGSGHHRHHRLVAVVANSHLDLVRKVDAVDPFQKSMNEMLTRLLAVADDVDAAILLQLHRKDGGVALALGEFCALEPPGRPELLGFGEPGRFRQTSCDRGVEHAFPASAGSVRRFALPVQSGRQS